MRLEELNKNLKEDREYYQAGQGYVYDIINIYKNLKSGEYAIRYYSRFYNVEEENYMNIEDYTLMYSLYR